MIRRAVSWVVWPLGLVAFITSILHFADLNDPLSISTTAGRSFLVALVILLVLEVLIPFRGDWRVRGDTDIWRDIGHAVLYGQVGMAVAQLAFLVGLVALLAPLDLPGIWPTTAPLIVQVLLAIVVGDGLEYWLHRLSHTMPALWRVHAVHHMPTRLHMLKAARHHVLYFPLRGVIVWIPMLLIGTPPELIVWQFVGAILTGNIDHANIDFRIPAFVHRLLVTPQFHRVHHGVDPRQGNSNFGVMLPIWDMIFGTYIDPLRTRVDDVGIPGDPVPHRFGAELLLPFTPNAANAPPK